MFIFRVRALRAFRVTAGAIRRDNRDNLVNRGS
jgi:hypothetical protein